MRKDSVRDMGVGVFFLGISILYLTGTFSISTFSPFGNRGLDSRSIPQLIGVLGCVLSVAQIAVAGVKMKQSKSRRPVESDVGGTSTDAREAVADEAVKVGGKRATVLLFASLFLLTGYILLFQRIGFVASTILYLFFSILLLTPDGGRLRSLPLVVFFSIGVPFLIYVLFTKYLSLILPRGILG